MKLNNLYGFSILEVAVSITLFTILAPSIYLMITYLMASSNSISNQYLEEMIYRSYLEKQIILNKKPIESKRYENIKLIDRNQKVFVKIEKTPNSKILLISIKPSNKDFPILKAYLRVQ